MVKRAVPMRNKSTRVDMSGVVDGLKKLGAAREPVARAMGVGMGQAVRDEAKIRAPVLKPGNEGYDGQEPGTLRDAIYLAFDSRRYVLNPQAFRYTVSWNARRAAHGHLAEFGFEQKYVVMRGGPAGLFYTPLTGRKGAKGRNTGFARDAGPIRIAPQPFLGPAFDAKYPQLLTIATLAGRNKFRELMG